MTPPRRPRSGYTLVELLVVMALIVLLSALAATVASSGLIGSQKVVSAADRASGWLLISKQRAMRDGAPRGVRFLGKLDSTGSYVEFTEAQYVEAPEPWVPNPNPDPNGPRIVFEYTYTTTGTGSTAVSTVATRKVFYVAPDMTEFDQRVSPPKDYLVLPEFKRSFLITGIGALNAGRKELILASYPDLAAGGVPTTAPSTTVTYQFAFQPTARPLLGEPVLQLTKDVVIDYRRPSTTATPTPTTTIGIDIPTTAVEFDILFSPSGQVVGNPAALICLWVRNPEKLPAGTNPRNDMNNAGEQALVVIYPRSGLVATQPPDPDAGPTGDVYKFAKDGINAGL